MVELVRSRAALQAEILILQHQLIVLRRKSPKRVAVGNIDRPLFVGLFRFSRKALDALKIFKPETVLRWHRAGFGAYWRWKSRSCGGRPKTPVDTRQLIREMSVANPSAFIIERVPSSRKSDGRGPGAAMRKLGWAKKHRDIRGWVHKIEPMPWEEQKERARG